MRVLGWVLALALALTASIGSRPGRWVRATIQCPTAGTGTGDEFPIPRANGKGRARRVGFRTVFWAGVVPIRGRGCLPTGSGVPAVAPLIILSRIGAVRLGAGKPITNYDASRYSSHGVRSSMPVKASRIRSRVSVVRVSSITWPASS